MERLAGWCRCDAIPAASVIELFLHSSKRTPDYRNPLSRNNLDLLMEPFGNMGKKLIELLARFRMIAKLIVWQRGKGMMSRSWSPRSAWIFRRVKQVTEKYEI